MAVIEHTARAFDGALRELTRMTAKMGAYAERQTIEAVDALVTRDSERGRRVVIADTMIDTVQREIEEMAIATIATRQPVAIDLREIVAALRISNQLERIGDLAKNIGKRTVVLDGKRMPRQALRGIVLMTDIAIQLLRDVLDSYSERNAGKALEVWKSDEKLDAMYSSLASELLTYMMEQPTVVTSGIHLLFCGKNIERIGDHATNIAEAVCYIANGNAFSNQRPKVDTTHIVTIGSKTSF